MNKPEKRGILLVLLAIMYQVSGGESFIATVLFFIGALVFYFGMEIEVNATTLNIKELMSVKRKEVKEE